ncbi:S24 family peptidase [uncultured Parabacteroides sp.]|uniref:S24 family peptidase n=1 Tax=uncultured Parabacteroides sp. TaxID=512312 RepID=UPI0026597DD8|nr:S24 family peptidase [uncultured Parabacteroides sp.]
MTTKERFIEYLKFKGLGQTAFEESAGLSRGSIAKKTGFNADSIEKIATACPDLNINWLVTGLGEMLSHSNDEEEPQISYTQGVPYYNVDFIGGFDLVLNDQTINPEYLIDFQKYNNADCWCNVTGHSMEPEINHGDIIALKKIDDISFLPLGEVYAIVTTNDMRTIKRLGAGKTDDTYTLVPSNKSPEYSTQQLPARMIRTIFQVLGAVKRF